MDAVKEAPMTPAQGDSLIAEWTSKLQSAQQALAAHEQQMGQAALAGTASNVAQELHKLEVDVKVATQALEAAQKLRKPAELQARIQQLENLRQQMAEAKERMAEQEKVIAELDPKLKAAYDIFDGFSRDVSRLQISIVNLDMDIRKAQGN